MQIYNGIFRDFLYTKWNIILEFYNKKTEKRNWIRYLILGFDGAMVSLAWKVT